MRAAGHQLVIRSAAPLAAYLAGAKSTGLIDIGPARREGPTLVVAGSHTAATTEQLTVLWRDHPATVMIDTEAALQDPDREADRAGTLLRTELGRQQVVTLATDRSRRAEHGSLEQAAAIMQALSRAVARVADLPGRVIAKGGITSAQVARVGFGAAQAVVRGQVAVGISVWALGEGADRLPFVVVPGNIGGADTLKRLVER